MAFGLRRAKVLV